MPDKIKIKTEILEITAELTDSPTARKILNILPINANVHRWGGEIYFQINVNAEIEPNSREILQPGELAYWPPGKALCIFFGKTPASQAQEIRAASNVNIIGKITAPLDNLWNINDGELITIEKEA